MLIHSGRRLRSRDKRERKVQTSLSRAATDPCKNLRALAIDDASRQNSPIIITAPGREVGVSTGRTIRRSGGAVSALVDAALETNVAVCVILPDGTFLGEVLRCQSQENTFVVDLMLIRYEAKQIPGRAGA